MALIQDTVGTLPYLLNDLDQHYYEAQDCFTRYMPKSRADTAVHVTVAPSGRKVLLANDRIVTALEEDLEKAYVPGSLVEMLKKRSSGDPSDAERFFTPMLDEYLDKDARLVQMAEQQVERSIVYPGWGLFAEEYIDGIDPLYDNLESYNKWVNDDWGFNYKDAIFAPAMLSLRDLDRAVAELDRVLADGVRFVLLPAGPAYGRSPGDPYFDPFWARVNEAKLVVCFHITEFYYQENVAADWGWKAGSPFGYSAWQWQNSYGERPICDMLSALIFDNVFGRFPNIRVVVSEFGAAWVANFVRQLDKSRAMARMGPWIGGPLTERPSKIFKRHVKVVPYPEDDVVTIVKQLGGTESLVMGSDWPHAEGLREPAEMYRRVEGLDEPQRRHFLRDNAIGLFTQ